METSGNLCEVCTKRQESGFQYKKLTDAEETSDKRDVQPMTRKLMLGGLLWGAEAANNFAQLNFLPALQMLGMPLKMVSLTNAVSGPCTMFLIPLLGWLTDRGSNPHCRRTVATICISGTLVSGIGCILAASLIHLNHLYENTFDIIHINSSSSANATVHFACGNKTGSSIVDVKADPGELGDNTDNASMVLENLNQSCPVNEHLTAYSQIPFKAGLAMFGFILLDTGFDGTCSFAKSYMVACSPASEHTSLLVISVIMASGGGLSMSVLGMMDVRSLPGLPAVNGNGLTVKIATEALVVIGCMVLGLLVTLLTGWLQRRQTRLSDTVDDHAHCDTINIHRSLATRRNADTEIDINHIGGSECTCNSYSIDDSEGKKASDSRSCLTEVADENNFEEKADTAVKMFYREVTSNICAEENIQGPTLDTKCNDKKTEKSPSIEKEHTFRENLSLLKLNSFQEATIGQKGEKDLEKGEKFPAEAKNSLYGAIESAAAAPQTIVDSSLSYDTLPEREVEGSADDAKRDRICCPGDVRWRIALIMLSTALTVGTAYLFSMSSSDYVAKAIYGGKPDADGGTESQSRYAEGIKMASKGLCVHYAAYLLFSFPHHRLLAYLGYRAEFLLAQALMVACMVILALTARLEVFFVMAAIAGVHRVSFHVLPFAAAVHILRKADPQSSQQGFVISLVTASIALGNSVFFVWMGPLEQLTGLVSMPLWMGAVYGSLAALVFFVIGDVN